MQLIKCFDRKQDDEGFKTLDKLVDDLKKKLIRMADKSAAGWIIVDEYLTDKFASNSDEKRLRQAEARALRKKKAKSSHIIVPRA